MPQYIDPPRLREGRLSVLVEAFVHPVQAIVLALVQGITEFLPISSSAHLILTSRWLGWEDQGLHFDMAVHVGSLAAIVAYLRSDLAGILRAFARRGAQAEAATRRLGWQVLAATVPVALLGWPLQGSIERLARDPMVIAVCSIVFGVALWAADRFGARRMALTELSWLAVLSIGVAQALALVPGTSRSGVVMTAALFVGLGRTAAARFSFLLAVPVLLLVAGKNAADLLSGAVVAPDWAPLAIGFVVSAVSSWLAADWLLRWLRRQGVTVFAVYRVILGFGLLIQGVL